MLLKDCKEEFIFDCQCRRLAAGTIRNYTGEIDYFFNYLQEKHGITQLEQVKSAHIREFLLAKQEEGKKPAYINDLLKAYKCLFKYLYQESYTAANIAARVKNVHQPKVIIATFSEQEIKRMLNYYSGFDYISVRNKAMIALLFDTGVRCNEMIMMKEADVAFDYIVVKYGKGGKERVVPKSPYLGKLLLKYKRVKDGFFAPKALRYDNLFLSKTGKPLTGEAISQVLKAAGKAVGVSDSVRVSPHTCRHTFAQIQLKNGLDLYSLSRLMGHENISITQRYLQGLRDRDIILNSNRTSPLMNL